MNKMQCCVAGMILTLPVAARVDALQTGLYAVTEEEKGYPLQRVDTSTGDEVRVDGLLSDKLREVSFVSLANDNGLYRLSLKAGPIPEGADKGHLAVVVAGQCMVVYACSDRQADGCVSVSATVAGKEPAERIARELGVKLQLRKHPGHKLLVAVEPKEASYRPNEPVTLVMTIKNVGETTVSFFDGGQQRGPRNNQFSFIALRSSGRGPALPDTGDPTNFGGMACIKKLAPEAAFTKEVLLTDWFEFSEPGAYRITTLYELGLVGEDRRTIWDDFAVARCIVRIEEKARTGGQG